MKRDILEELREEWYSEPENKPETIDEVLEDELLELQVLFRSRGTTISGSGSVKLTSDEPEQDKDNSDSKVLPPKE